MAAHEMENRRIVGKGTHCKLDYLRGKDGSSRCGCHCCFLAWEPQCGHWGKGWQKYNLKGWIAGKKWHGISVLFVYREQTMWVLIDLQNLIAIIMEHRMVVLEGGLQWQQAYKAVWDALGLSWYSCTCAPLTVKPKHTAHLVGVPIRV